MTENLLFQHNDRPIELKLIYFPEHRETRHSPGEDAQVEVEAARYQGGPVLTPDEVDHLMCTSHYDEIINQLELELNSENEYIKSLSYAG